MRYFAILFTLLFAAFAVLQLKYSDKIWWGSVYLAAAAISFQVYKGKILTDLIIGFSLFCAVYSLYLITSMNNLEDFLHTGEVKNWEDSEYVRKAKGLGICMFAMLSYIAYFFYTKRQKPVFAHPENA